MSGAGRGTPRVGPVQPPIPNSDPSGSGSVITQVTGAGTWVQTFGSSGAVGLATAFPANSVYFGSGEEPFIESGVVRGAMEFIWTFPTTPSILEIEFKFSSSYASGPAIYLPMSTPDITNVESALIHTSPAVYRIQATGAVGGITSPHRGLLPIPIPVGGWFDLGVFARSTTGDGDFKSVQLILESFGGPVGNPVFGP